MNPLVLDSTCDLYKSILHVTKGVLNIIKWTHRVALKYDQMGILFCFVYSFYLGCFLLEIWSWFLLIMALYFFIWEAVFPYLFHCPGLLPNHKPSFRHSVEEEEEGRTNKQTNKNNDWQWFDGLIYSAKLHLKHFPYAIKLI